MDTFFNGFILKPPFELFKSHWRVQMSGVQHSMLLSSDRCPQDQLLAAEIPDWNPVKILRRLNKKYGLLPTTMFRIKIQ